MTFNELKRLSKKSATGSARASAALLGDTPTQFMAAALKATFALKGETLDLYEAPYSQIDFELFGKNSPLKKLSPEYIIIFQSAQKLMQLHAACGVPERKKLAAARRGFIKKACAKFSRSKIICLNYAEIDDGVFGSHACKEESSFSYQARKLNFLLCELAAKTPNLRICDIAAAQSKIGGEKFFAPALYASAEIAIAPDALPQICEKIYAIAAADFGKAKKCAVLDLDNFLWGGTVGDDGAENLQISSGLGIGRAFADIQRWCKKLKERGVILAACSKNDEAAAKEPFLKLPDMVLKLGDFSKFVANWRPKSENIARIARELNISADSIVFLDDSPAERAEVRKNLPEVCVPELPGDPALFLDFLSDANLFETAEVSNEDAMRSKFYADEEERKSLSKSFGSYDAFLKGLEMSALAEPFGKLNAPRVAQLLQRTNQFNMRTKRYSQSEILEFAADKNFQTFAFSLSDKIGASGIVAAAVLRAISPEEIFIDTFAMSCRAFGRGLEFFAFNKILESAKSRGFKRISAEFIPTAKNKIAADFYLKLGFAQIGESGGAKKFALETKAAKPVKTFIKEQ